MHVQDRSATDHRHSTVSAVPAGGGLTNSLNSLSSRTSLHLSKILITFLLIASGAAILILLPLISNTSAFLCFQKSSSSRFIPSHIHLPYINFNSIPPIPPSPSDPFSSFRAHRWIIVVAAAPSRPSPSLLRLTAIKNWQLLAVATSQTPLNFSLQNAIFLSLDLQSRLNFRSTDFLPHNSHARKSVGYLFAIQHGARIIYDADDRADVLEADIGLRFDLQLSAGSEILLQYSHHNPNRTVVNPYIHFGQHSVWPRGFPLDRVSIIDNEEFYTESYSGHQFI